MLNKIIIMGRLVRDPELRRTQSGTAVASFRLAVDRDYKAEDGSKQADFFDVVAWRNTGEFVSRKMCSMLLKIRFHTMLAYLCRGCMDCGL